MVKIISSFISFLNILRKFLFKFECFLLHFLPNDPCSSSISEAYRHFSFDELPILEPGVIPISFDQAKSEYELKYGKPLTPVKHRNNKIISTKVACPHCGATHEYLYLNNGKHGFQFKCKCCDFTFTKNTSYDANVIYYCPHCGSKLAAHHDRSHYVVYRCPCSTCPLYLNNLNALTPNQKLEFNKKPYAFKLRYTTRIFTASIPDLEQLQPDPRPSKIHLSRIRYSKHVLGLILTYYVNYGHSLRQTASILRDVHNIKLSHQTVANYAEAASRVLAPWLSRYKYDRLSDQLCGDETYIKVLGKKAYVFFICDTKSRIISSYNAFIKRDTFSAIQTFFSTLNKYFTIPESLHIVVDGNPIYKAAQQFFQLNRVFFKVSQVIGLTNDDPISAEFRPAKQIIERLNRTFKSSYTSKNGFTSIEKANEWMCLFTTYFNFLRKHSSLGYKTPVTFNILNDHDLMPMKWLTLINNASLFNIELSSQQFS